MTTRTSVVTLAWVVGAVSILAWYQPNLGPNIQTQQPPQNPVVQSIHPR